MPFPGQVTVEADLCAVVRKASPRKGELRAKDEWVRGGEGRTEPLLSEGQCAWSRCKSQTRMGPEDCRTGFVSIPGAVESGE